MIPLDATDLPAWVVAIHDNYLRDPKLLRLATWARLEREPVGDLFTRRGGIHQWTIEAQRRRTALADTVRRAFCR